MVILIYFYKSTPKYTNYMCLCRYPNVIHIIILIIRFLKELLNFLIFVEKDQSNVCVGFFYTFFFFVCVRVMFSCFWDIWEKNVHYLFGKSLVEYYSTLNNLWNHLLQYRPLTIDLKQHKRYWEEFMTTTLLSSLDSDLHGFKDQILSRETLTSAANINSHYCAHA